jgi:hypothetical protein
VRDVVGVNGELLEVLGVVSEDRGEDESTLD